MRSLTDITKVAMEMLPVNSIDDIIRKLEVRKIAEPEMVRNLVRTVNKEQQYQNLKDAKFKLAQVVRTHKPIDPEMVLQKMGLKRVGRPVIQNKAATFKQLRNAMPARKAASFRKVATLGNIQAQARETYDLIKTMRKKASESMAHRRRWIELRKIAEVSYQSNIGTLTAYSERLREILKYDPVLCRKIGLLNLGDEAPTPVKYRAKDSGVTAVTEWAHIHRKISELVPETRVMQYILETQPERIVTDAENTCTDI